MTCQNCAGTGKTNDVSVASITHRRSTIQRKCRYCKGTGQIQPPPEPEPQEVGEAPDWMNEL